jgi:adhesin/invasin
VPILPGLAIEGGRRSYAGSTPDENFLRVSYNLIDMNTAKPSQPWFSERAYQLNSMEDRRYDKVRRENLIVKQKKSDSFSVGVTGF